MYINKYGIIIKKMLYEKYPRKYEELESKKILLQIIQEKQIEIINYRKELMEKNRPLTRNRIIKITDVINEQIDRIIQEISKENN